MENYDNKILWVDCDCYSDAMKIEYEVDHPFESFDISIYHCGHNGRHNSLWNRIKYCLWHLRTGKVYSDQIIIQPEEAKRIVEFLNSCKKEETK